MSKYLEQLSSKAMLLPTMITLNRRWCELSLLLWVRSAEHVCHGQTEKIAHKVNFKVSCKPSLTQIRLNNQAKALPEIARKF